MPFTNIKAPIVPIRICLTRWHQEYSPNKGCLLSYLAPNSWSLQASKVLIYTWNSFSIATIVVHEYYRHPKYQLEYAWSVGISVILPTKVDCCRFFKFPAAIHQHTLIPISIISNFLTKAPIPILNHRFYYLYPSPLMDTFPVSLVIFLHSFRPSKVSASISAISHQIVVSFIFLAPNSILALHVAILCCVGW